MPEAYDNSFLPQDDPAVLEFARYCMLQQILQSPDGFSKAEEMLRDPEEYVRLHCMALFAQLKDEYRLHDQAPGPAVRGSDGSPDWIGDPFDFAFFDEDPSNVRLVDPGSLRLNDGDVRRLAQEIRMELPYVIALKRAGAASLPGPLPPRIKAAMPRGMPSRDGRGPIHACAARHSRRWREEFSKG